MNRANRRHKTKNREATKKGMTKVIYIDDNNLPTAHYVKAGGKIHKQAIKNAQRFRKAQSKGV